MKLSLSLVLPLAAAWASASASSLEKRASMYDGFQVYKIQTGVANYDAAAAAVDAMPNVVTLNCVDNHDHIEVAVGPADLPALQALGFPMTLLNGDLGAELRLEGENVPYVAMTSRVAANLAATGTDGTVSAAVLPDISYFNSYHVFDDHLAWLADLQASFPGNSQVFTAGKSLEGRPIQGIHLYGKDGPGKHEAIIWHATVHAREWITSPTVEYMAYQLVNGYLTGDTVSKNAIDAYDFYIMPVVNPDGFVYTQTNRLWRKNRQTRSGQSCVGTDVNRNWPYKWDVPGGSSTDPCAETYRGLAAGDTPEMAVLTNHTMSLAESQGIKFFVDWHSYSQLILLPYGYSCSAVAANNAAQMTLAKGVAAAIKGVNGLSFVYGPTCTTIYQASGGSMDWVTDVAKAEVAWGVELRPSSSASNGFVVPASNILPSGKEIWAGMRWLLEQF